MQIRSESQAILRRQPSRISLPGISAYHRQYEFQSYKQGWMWIRLKVRHKAVDFCSTATSLPFHVKVRLKYLGGLLLLHCRALAAKRQDAVGNDSSINNALTHWNHTLGTPQTLVPTVRRTASGLCEAVSRRVQAFLTSLSTVSRSSFSYISTTFNRVGNLLYTAICASRIMVLVGAIGLRGGSRERIG